MILESYTKSRGLYNKMYEEIYITQYESTLNEGWLYRNHSKEAEIYKSMTEKEQYLYAHRHATWWVDQVMAWTLKEFNNYFGNQYEFVFYGDCDKLII